jgi:SNF2 family DNA or RNA helicase
MKYEKDDHHIYINAPLLNAHTMKSSLNATKVKKGWRLPRNLWAYRELFMLFPALKENTQFMFDAKKESLQYADTLAIKQRVDTDGQEGLRPYQKVDVAFLKSRTWAGVYNAPRTGKSPTVISLLNELNPLYTLLVVPSSLTYNWKNEIEKWGEYLKPFVYSGTPKKRKETFDKFLQSGGALIISKDTFKKEVELLSAINYDVAIIDESHFLRNYKTAQSKAIYQIKAKRRYALTGTPSTNHGVDIWGILHFLSPKDFPSYWSFAERYFIVNNGQWGGKEIGAVKTHRENELKGILELTGVQRKRKDVMNWLPKTQFQTLPVQMEGKQLKLYDQMLNDFIAVSEDGHEVDTMNVLTQLMRLRQICLEPELLGFTGVIGAKTKALLDFAENNNDPFIVMTTFSSYFPYIQPKLEKLGKRVAIIDGKVSQKEKFKVAEEFQKGKIDILLCNIISAGTGFTLDKADTILFLDKDFNPSNNEQAGDRIVPTTKARNHSVNIISLVCQNSIDERINELLDRKEDLTKLVNKKELVR